MAPLLRSALDHIVELDARLESERSASAMLRANVVSERGRADRADARASEAEWRACDAERQLRKQEERLEEARGELEDANAASDMDRIGEVNELKGRIRGLTHEIALLKGIA